MDRVDVRRLAVENVAPDGGYEGNEEAGQNAAQRQGGTESMFLLEVQLEHEISSRTMRAHMRGWTYFGDVGCDKEGRCQDKCYYRRSDEGLCSMDIEVLGPQGEPALLSLLYRKQ